MSLAVQLPKEIHQYCGRRCDCDFCVERDVVYLSDSSGSFAIQGVEHVEELQQGSNQAHFLACKHCQKVLCVVLKLPEHKFIGAINLNCLCVSEELEDEPASPKLLSATDKNKRWQTIWMPAQIN